MINPQEFKTIELGTVYRLPLYKVVDEKGLQKKDPEYSYPACQFIAFVRGDRSDNGKVIPRVDGVLHEGLLAMIVEDLKYKNSLVPSPYTTGIIEDIENALAKFQARAEERKAAGTQGTYQK